MNKAFREIKNRIILLIITLLFIIFLIYHYKLVLLILLIISNTTLSNDILNYFIFTTITELFLIYVLLGFFIAKYVVFYFLFYHSLCFLSAGLYRTEYNYLKFAFLCSFFISFLSHNFFSNILVPILSNFFLSFQENVSVPGVNFYFEAKIYDYLKFFTEIYMNCFLSFQGSILLIILSKHLSKNIQLLKITRKFLYLLFLIFSTLITPPDIISQLLVFSGFLTIFETLLFLRLLKKSLSKLIRQKIKTN